MSLELIKASVKDTKPAEVRIANWQSFLQKMFLFETDIMNEVLRDEPDANLVPVISPNLNPEQVSEILSKIKSIEDKITEYKKKKTESQNRRKEYTGQLDIVSGRLMLPEKTYDEYVQKLSSGLLPIKKLEESERLKKLKRENEVKIHRQNVQTGYNQNVAEQKRYINERVNVLFNHAIENIDVDDFTDYFLSCQDEAEKTEFRKPENKYGDKEFQEINDEIYNQWNPQLFREIFNKHLAEAFANFSTAKENKQKAIDDMERQQKAISQEVEFDLTMDNQVAKLEASVTSQSTMNIATKQLKKVFVVDMIDSDENMVSVVRAFFANLVDCMANYRGERKKLTIQRMEELLAELKNKDKSFQPDGIIFVEKDKL